MPFKVIKSQRKDGIEYLNVSCAFDTESTSFYENPATGETRHDPLSPDWEKRAVMYAWVFGINGRCVIGRTWKQLLNLFKLIKDVYGLEPGKRHLVCYVHNLAHDFQFMRGWMEWQNVFASKERTPIYAVSGYGIEFRCSLILSGYSLAKTCEHLQKYKVAKLVGDLDYDLMRHTKTPLSEKEIGYIVHDALGVMAYIQELIEERKYVTRIPLTKTGFVREYVKKRCFWDKASHRRDRSHKYENYSRLMRLLTLNGSDEYLLARQAFHGGMVHANASNAGKVLENVASYDFSSSYPACIVMERFPMGKGEKVKPKNADEFREYLRLYHAVMDVTFIGLESKEDADHPISASKCLEIKGFELDNGRIIDAEYCRICITNIDLEVYERFYDYESMQINKMYVYKRGYLPTDFVKAVLELYQKKTELKGIEGSEAEYLGSKELLNACFGMCVTDICHDENKYEDGEWRTETANIEKSITDYNESKSRFLSYLWGIFITSFALRNLASGIIACSHDPITWRYTGDYCYCDTDSVKVMHHERYKTYFDDYNAMVERKLRDACSWHRIPFSMCCPKTIDGKEKMLGVWDFEGVYARAKFMGAKRYAIEDGNGCHSITIAGVNKKTAVPVLDRRAKEEGRDFFDFIEFDYTFDKEACGKMLHTYIDSPTKGVLCDFKGIPARYEERSGVHLEPTTYKMTIDGDYLELLKSFTDIRFMEERWAG